MPEPQRDDGDVDPRLQASVADRRFRSDLYFRLNVIPIEVPPLRARGDDIVLLARHFTDMYARQDKRVMTLSPEAQALLRAHPWPGNVRELQNCIERAVALSDHAEISAQDLPEAVRRMQPAPTPARNAEAPPIVETGSGVLLPLSEVERRHILFVLGAVDGNKRLAARILGIDRRTLYRKLDEYETHDRGAREPTQPRPI